MHPKSPKSCQDATSSAFPPREQHDSKPSMLRRLKILVARSPSREQSHASSSTSSAEAHRRRAEALRACGLLDQSVKYGGPYRDEPHYDEEDETRTIVSSEHSKSDVEKEKDLLIFEGKVEEVTTNKEESDGEVCSPTPPLAAVSMRPVPDSDTTSITESDSSTIVPQQAPIRMRRIGSVAEEINQIEDEESRRLAEIAFLS